MASALIHLAIGKVYVKKFGIENQNEFEEGIVAPDIISMQSKEMKNKAHYSPYRPDHKNFTLLKTKTDLYQYLLENNIDSDYDLGYFLHLVADYYFFAFFLFREELENYENLFPTIREDYGFLAEGVREKYQVDDSNTPWFDKSRNGQTKILKLEEVYEFIEKCGKINLYELRDVILNAKDNWRTAVAEIWSN